MEPPALSTIAVWYWPVEDIDTERHVLLPGSVRAVHVTPKSEEVQIFPLEATALWYCPVEDKDAPRQSALATGAYLSVSTFTLVPNNDPLVCDRYHVFPS